MRMLVSEAFKTLFNKIVYGVKHVGKICVVLGGPASLTLSVI